MIVDWAIIDGVSPFFRGITKRKINWSKIHLASLPLEGEEGDQVWSEITLSMREFCQKVKAQGYNTVTFDDVPHLTNHDLLECEAKEKVRRYRERFKPLINLVRSYDLRVLVTTDIIPTTSNIDAKIGKNEKKLIEYFCELVENFLDDFPEVSGVIARLGESDGHDVKDLFRSRLLLRTAKQTNQLLKRLLPLFERRGKTLICRTWTVGAYAIGDLIWHKNRLASTFSGLKSPWFVASMKYGESDFFRYLPLNQSILYSPVSTIIEYQARREYEGAGEYPSFVGFDAEEHMEKLRHLEHLVGFSVWCQTGGWHAFRRLAFLQKESFWIEQNCQILADLFLKGMSVEQSLVAQWGEELGVRSMEFYKLSDVAIKKYLYMEEFSTQNWFFRRLRVPPLFHVYWDRIFINYSVKQLAKYFVRGRSSVLHSKEELFLLFYRMENLAKMLDWPVGDVRFMRDSFELMRLARMYYFTKYSEELVLKIEDAKAVYKKTYPRDQRQRYRIRTDFSDTSMRRRRLEWAHTVLLREKRRYRLLDYLFSLTVLSWGYQILITMNPKL